MKYLFVLDYEHLDNGLFLTSIAQILGQLQNREQVPVMVVHGESEYTERLIQTGIMREEATVRAIKDLNHRLIALFADEGVSAVGINGYQRECIQLKDGELKFDRDYFETLHQGPVLLLSNLVLDQHSDPVPVQMDRFVENVYREFKPDQIVLFSKYDHTFTSDKDRPKQSRHVPPEELQDLSVPIEVTTIEEFRNKFD